jgi:uncharacterized protein
MKKPAQPKHELRVASQPQRFEVRKNADGSRSIAGYAAVFNGLSQDLGGFKEKISPGAFKESLSDNPDVLIYFGHDHNQILGRVSSGTLTIAEDAKGLKFRCVLPNTSTANDLIELMERGDISSMSFGFYVPDGGDDWSEVNGQIVRTLNNVVLLEVSVVGQPAYTQASVSLRSLPASLRGKVKGKRDVDNPDSTECDCTCEQCEDDRCEECSNSLCESDSCIGCATQVLEAHRSLLMRRLRS